MSLTFLIWVSQKLNKNQSLKISVSFFSCCLMSKLTSYLNFFSIKALRSVLIVLNYNNLNQLFSKLTMRLIRPHSANKQNLELASPSTQRNKFDDVKRQLRNAYAQINMLNMRNKQLTRRLQQNQKQLSETRTLREELQFMKEQEHNVKQQLLNYEEMNKKLRDQLQKTQRENKQLKQYNSNQIDNKSTTRQLFTNQGEVHQTPRSSFYQTRMNSSTNERVKNNHSSTPKSKVQINFHEFLQDQMPQKRRVFL